MARKQALKVFRTPIGFHDAYVAATSRKAALAAWGSTVDLFARGVAEEVTDDALKAEALARPGEVIKRARGSDAEHLAAATAPPQGKAKGRSKTQAIEAKADDASRKPCEARPSRATLDAAERGLDDLEERYRRDSEALRRREREVEQQRRALEQERQALERSHDRDREAAEAKIASESQRHAEALDRWVAARGER